MNRFLALILAVSLLLTACGGSGPAPTEEQTSGAQEEQPSSSGTEQQADDPSATGSGQQEDEVGVELDNLESFDELPDVLRRFSLMAYEFAGPEGAAEVRIEVLGREEVDGVQTDHVTIDFTAPGSETERMEMWVNAQGETLRMIENGEELSKEAAAMGGAMLAGFFWPFMTAEAMDLEAAVREGGSSSLFHASKVEKRREEFGGMPAVVYSITVEVRSTSEGGTFTWEVADFGEFQLFTSWQVSQPGTGVVEFRVREIKPRQS